MFRFFSLMISYLRPDEVGFFIHAGGDQGDASMRMSLLDAAIARRIRGNMNALS